MKFEHVARDKKMTDTGMRIYLERPCVTYRAKLTKLRDGTYSAGIYGTTGIAAVEGTGTTPSNAMEAFDDAWFNESGRAEYSEGGSEEYDYQSGNSEELDNERMRTCADCSLFINRYNGYGKCTAVNPSKRVGSAGPPCHLYAAR